MRRSSKGVEILSVLFLAALAALIWQFGEDALNRRRELQGLTSLEFFIPSPKHIVGTFIEHFQQIQSEFFATLSRSAVGFLFGALLALATLVGFELLPLLRRLSLPFAFAANSFPILALAPVLVLALGQGSYASIVSVSAVVTYFPILLTIDAAMLRVPAAMLDVVSLYRATKSQRLFFVKIPLTLPALFTGLRLSLPASFVGAIVGEWMGARTGVGRLMILSIYQMNPGLMYSCMIESAAICSLLAGLVTAVERRALFWNR